MAKEENGWEDIKPAWWKKNKIGDHIIGTLIGVREVQSTLPDQKGAMVKVYEIKSDSGEFHDLDDSKKVIEEPVVIKADEVWNISGGSKEKPSMIDERFRNVKLGDKIKVVYTGDKPPKTKGYNPLKIVAVQKNGKVDQAWLDEQKRLREEEADNQGFAK